MLDLDAPHPNTVAAKGRRPEPQVDLEALAAHYRQAHRRLHLHAVGIVGSSDLADDIVQEAFAIATAKIGQGVEIRNLSAWMNTVVRNLSIDGLTRKGRDRRTFSPLPEEPQTPALDSPPGVAHLRQGCEAIYREVADLPPAQRSAFVMAELRGFKYAEIAADLQRTEQAVRDLLSRARHRIREAVGPDAMPLNVPLAGVHLRGLIEPRGRAHAVGDYLAAKLANLHAAVSSLLQRSAEIVAQPAAPLVAGALVAGGITLAVSGPQTQMPVQAGGAPPVTAAPESSTPAEAVSPGRGETPAAGDRARPVAVGPAPAAVGDGSAEPQTPSADDRTPHPGTTGAEQRPRPANTAAAEAQGGTTGDEAADPGEGPSPGTPPPPGPRSSPPQDGGGDQSCIGAGCGKGGAEQDPEGDELPPTPYLVVGADGTGGDAETVASQGGADSAGGDPSPAGTPPVNGAPSAPCPSVTGRE